MKIVTKTQSDGSFRTVATVEIWNEGVLLVTRMDRTMQDAASSAVQELRHLARRAEKQLMEMGLLNL